MPKLSEKKRLLITIAITVLLTGGLVALVMSDRDEIEGLNGEIEELDGRIASADVEIRKTHEREDKAIVFRAVEARELAILPDQQKIADFFRNLSKFFVAAGLKFKELPQSQPVESDLAAGIFVTRNQVECQGDTAALLKFLNMVENDPRLVAIKGLKVEAADARQATAAVSAAGTPQHGITVHLETYSYNPTKVGFQPVTIPGEEQRLQDPAVKEAIASFQPERPDTYVLRPSASRRDPLVDPRKRRTKVDEEAEAAEFQRQEGVAIELETSLRDISEMHEQLKALMQSGELFKADRLGGDIDAKVNELRGRLAQVGQMKTVTNPTLTARVQVVQQRIDEFMGRRIPRESTVTRSVAEKTLAELRGHFENHAFAEVGSLGSAWSEYLKGKEVEADARPVLEGIAVLRARARVLSEADGFVITITGTIVDEIDPARSMARVNGMSLHEGDAVDEKKEIRVHRILRAVVEFQYQGEVFSRERQNLAGGRPAPKPGTKPGEKPAVEKPVASTPPRPTETSAPVTR